MTNWAGVLGAAATAATPVIQEKINNDLDQKEAENLRKFNAEQKGLDRAQDETQNQRAYDLSVKQGEDKMAQSDQQHEETMARMDKQDRQYNQTREDNLNPDNPKYQSRAQNKGSWVDTYEYNKDIIGDEVKKVTGKVNTVTGERMTPDGKILPPAADWQPPSPGAAVNEQAPAGGTAPPANKPTMPTDEGGLEAMIKKANPNIDPELLSRKKAELNKKYNLGIDLGTTARKEAPAEKPMAEPANPKKITSKLGDNNAAATESSKVKGDEVSEKEWADRKSGGEGKIESANKAANKALKDAGNFISEKAGDAVDSTKGALDKNVVDILAKEIAAGRDGEKQIANLAKLPPERLEKLDIPPSILAKIKAKQKK